MTITTTDRRVMLCDQRRHELDRIALYQVQRRAICGCTRCADDDKGEELDALITRALANVAECEDLICTRSVLVDG